MEKCSAYFALNIQEQIFHELVTLLLYNTIYYTNRVKIVYNFTINRLYNLLLYIIDKTTVRYTGTYIWSCRLAYINQPCRDIKFSI